LGCLIAKKEIQEKSIEKNLLNMNLPHIVALWNYKLLGIFSIKEKEKKFFTINYWHIFNKYVDNFFIKKYIKNMNYYDFLKTPYWKIVSKKAKEFCGYRCMLCNSSNNLHTHHRTYEHHGEEHRYIKEDLIVLCKECHSKFHNIEE
jgi:hypothetical protein